MDEQCESCGQIDRHRAGCPQVKRRAAKQSTQTGGPMKHTQGPWRVREGSLYKEGTTEVNPNLPQRVCEHCKKPAKYADGSPLFDPAHISIEANGWGVAQIGTLNPVKEFEQHMANARLIAAAPDLLSALELIESSDSFNGGTNKKELQGIARAAINKAKGVT